MSTSVNWLVIGIGDITRKRVIPAILAEPRSRLHAVLTRDPRKAEAYPGVEAFTELSQALSDPAIEAVYVASPVALHAEQTIACLRAGKHVLCEKPMATSVADSMAMIKACKEANKKLMIAYRCHYEPTNLRAMQLIREGKLGKIQAIESANGFRERAGEWRLDRKLAGGGAFDGYGGVLAECLPVSYGRGAGRAQGVFVGDRS
jgi:predicted dehydrogenase